MKSRNFDVEEILKEIQLRKGSAFNARTQEPKRPRELPSIDQETLKFDALEAEEPVVDAASISATTKETLKKKRETLTAEFVQSSNIDIEKEELTEWPVLPLELAEIKEQSLPQEGAKRQLERETKLAWFELVVGIGSFLVLLWLFLINTAAEKVPEILRVVPSQLTAVVMAGAFLLIPAILSWEVLKFGFLSLFKMKATGASLLSLAFLASVVQLGFTLVNPYLAVANWQNMYSMVVVAALVCQVVNRLLKLKIAKNNAELLDAKKDKFTIQNSIPETVKQLNYVLGIDDSNACVAVKAKNFKNMPSAEYREDYFDKASRVVAPILLVLFLGMLGFLMFSGKDFMFAVVIFAGMAAMGAQLASNLSCSFFLWGLSRQLKKVGAGVEFLEALDVAIDLEQVFVKSEDAIKRTHIQLANLEMFEEKNIDLAILGAASILHAANAEIASLFMDMLASPDMVEEIEGLNVEGGMGFSGWWNNCRILFGTRQLMINHGVRTPSREFEKMRLSCKPGKIASRALYIALDGVLVALFVVAHKPILRVKRALLSLQKKKISVLMTTNDPTLLAEFMVSLYDLDRELFSVVPHSMGVELDDDLGIEEACTGIVMLDRIFGLVTIINQAKKTQDCAKLSTAMQCIGIGLGAGLVSFFAINGNLSQISGLNLLLYNVLWLGVCLFLPLLRGM